MEFEGTISFELETFGKKSVGNFTFFLISFDTVERRWKILWTNLFCKQILNGIRSFEDWYIFTQESN